MTKTMSVSEPPQPQRQQLLQQASSGAVVPPLPAAAQELAPALQLVQVVTRHGTRTPITVLPWMRAVEGEFACSASLQSPSAGSELFRKEYVRGAQTMPGTCGLGQLTIVGRAQALALGQGLRAHYVDALGFLPAVFSEQRVRVRSTDINRTIETAQGVVNGLYPPQTRLAGQVVRIETFDDRRENMYPRKSCQRYHQFRQLAKKSEAYRARDAQRLEFRRFIEKQTDHRLNSWEGIHNSMQCYLINGLKVPAWVTPEIVERMADESAFNYAVKFAHPITTRLGIGRFFGDLTDAIERSVATGGSGEQFVLYSGHDNTLGPLLAALTGVTDHPPVASSLIIELYASASPLSPACAACKSSCTSCKCKSTSSACTSCKKSASSCKSSSAECTSCEPALASASSAVSSSSSSNRSSHWVRVVYNGRPLALPECPEADAHGGLCPLPVFRRIAAGIVPKDYDEECTEVDDAVLESYAAATNQRPLPPGYHTLVAHETDTISDGDADDTV